MEEDKAISLSKEKASMQAIGQKEKLYNAEIASISDNLMQVFYSIRCDLINNPLPMYLVKSWYFSTSVWFDAYYSHILLHMSISINCMSCKGAYSVLWV